MILFCLIHSFKNCLIIYTTIIDVIWRKKRVKVAQKEHKDFEVNIYMKENVCRSESQYLQQVLTSL